MDTRKSIKVTPEVVVTQKMIDAGRKQLHESGMLPFGTEGQSYETEVLTAIFLAMLSELDRETP
jgi:hypothetical protein